MLHVTTARRERQENIMCLFLPKPVVLIPRRKIKLFWHILLRMGARCTLWRLCTTRKPFLPSTWLTWNTTLAKLGLVNYEVKKKKEKIVHSNTRWIPLPHINLLYNRVIIKHHEAHLDIKRCTLIQGVWGPRSQNKWEYLEVGITLERNVKEDDVRLSILHL